MKAITSKRFYGDESGAVAATYALALIPLIAFAGVGFDYARVMGLDSELQNGADQAALAAASQLDGQDGARERATTAATSMLQNLAVLSSDCKTVTVADAGTECDSAGEVRFYQDKKKTTAATEDDNANYVEVQVDGRELNYSLLPIVGAYGANLSGVAFAGVGSAICRVPPLMICSPSEDPDVLFDADTKVGIGIKATGGSSWSPGAFGFLEIGEGKTSELAEALAFDEGRFDCQKIDEGTNPETGNAQVLFDAVNTRFDVGFSGGGTLSPCLTGSCPPAVNVTKDLIKEDTTVNGNACRIHNSGWKLPPVAQRFSPRAYLNGDSSLSTFNASGMPLAMGLTRDMCHYISYKRDCPTDNGGLNDRFGDGTWAIQDYFARNHGMAPPVALSDPSSIAGSKITRYEVYRWEIDNNNFPGTINGQRSKPLCIPGTSNIDRRVLTVAIVRNCENAITVGGVTYEALKGGSRKALIEEWVDMFLVEPVVDDPDEEKNGRDKDMIYMEVIGEAKLGGSSGSPTSQAIRKDVPYLIE